MSMQAEYTRLYADLRQLVFHAAEQFPQTQFYLSHDPAFPFVTGQGLLEACGQFGSWISRRGQTGCHIALLGPNCAAWLTCFFAVISSGCAVVPLYYGSPLDDQASCLLRSDSVILLYDKSCEKDAVALREGQPGLEIFEMHSLLYELDSVGAATFPPLQQEDVCALYFTSGTTEQSRCVMLTHRNLGAMVSAAMPILPLSPKDTGLSIMPPSHTFEMMTNIVGALHCGGTLYINQSLRTVKSNLKKHQPTIIVTVPLLLQTLKKEILLQVRRRGKTEQFEKAMRISLKFRRRGIDISRKLFAEVFETLGKNLRYFICGGAALDPELITFFDGLGITVLQGYGITECSPIVACNTPECNRPGSIGQVFPSCEVQIIGGEICVRGESVSAGYYKDPVSTAAAYQDGWFHTGDLGHFDADGFLYYDGRCKNLIVLPNGENVSPEALEQKLYRVEGILDAVVYEKNGCITAEVWADPSLFPDRESLWQAISRVNRTVSAFQQIGDLVMRSEPFEKTATQKIKRYERRKEKA